jgi:hypothetical protein
MKTASHSGGGQGTKLSAEIGAFERVLNAASDPRG